MATVAAIPTKTRISFKKTEPPMPFAEGGLTNLLKRSGIEAEEQDLFEELGPVQRTQNCDTRRVNE
jgi:hypothetical protein